MTDAARTPLDLPIRRRWPQVLIVCVLTGYFLWLAGGGLWADFTPDDLMNLHIARSKPLTGLLRDNAVFFSATPRPLGSLFYRTLFEMFGFNPLPFRLLCLALALANVWLLYEFAARWSGSREVGVFSALIGGYHANLIALYWNTGTCYDLLSYFFYYSGFVYYISIRKRGKIPGAVQLGLILLAFVLALNSKEIAAAFPAVVAAYELFCAGGGSVRGPHRLVSWLVREGRLIVCSLLVAAVYAAGKLSGPESLAKMEAYRPEISLGSYTRSLSNYLNELFYRVDCFTPVSAALLVAVLLALVWRAESGFLRGCLVACLLGLVPIAFIPPRGLCAAYIPLATLWAFAGGAARWSRDRLQVLVLRNRVPVEMTQAVLFVLLGVCLASTHQHFGAFDVAWMTGEQRQIREVLAELDRSRIQLPNGARVLFVRDPFEERWWGRWTTFFILRLYYRDQTIEVERCSIPPSDSLRSTEAGYDAIITWQADALVRVSGCTGWACCSFRPAIGSE